jgi:hypothetical protein
LRSSSFYDYLSCKYTFPSPNEHKKHGAVDIVASTIGDEVYSISNGNVVYIIKHYHSKNNMSAVFVKYKLDDDSEIIVLYGHVYPLVEEGENIYKGQKIGEMRLFGDPIHIHFTITKNLNYHTDIKEGKNGEKNQFGAAYSDMVEPISFLNEHKPYEYKNMCFSDSYKAEEFQRESICKLKAKGIVKGQDDGKYHPNDTVTRAEFTKILLLSAEYTQDEIDNTESFNFSDIDGWYKNYINFAKSKDIIDGYKNRTFKPNEVINYAEASKIIVKTLIPQKIKIGVYKKWYEPFTSVLDDEPYNFTYPPEHNVTRAEMAYIISKVKGL